MSPILMNQSLACPVSISLCLHCGARVLQKGTAPFCCRGCATVFSLLQERGLNQFYTLRDQARGIYSPTPVADVSNEKFAYLDDQEFLREYSLEHGRKMRFYLEGAQCAACVWLTEKLPEFIEDVESLSLNLSTSVALVRIRPGGKFSNAATELLRLGYRPHPVKQDESDELRKKENRHHLIQLGIAGMVSGNIMILAIALYAGADGGLRDLFRWTSLLLFLPVLFYSAIPFYKSAWASLRRFQISIDVPIVFGLLVGTAASIVNLVIGSEHIYFDSLSALIFLLLSTRYLLRKVNQYSLNTTKVMHFLTPSQARRWEPATSSFEEVRTDALREGDLIQVLPGECFPVDGIVLQGESSVNCALLTGETIPQLAVTGSHVNAGTWNQQAPLQVKVLSSGVSTRLGKIIHSMEENLTRKAPIISYLDRVGQAFLGAVFVLTFLGFLLGLSQSWQEAIDRALAVAIVVCPCTFALATPLAISLAISRAAKAGMLIKGADQLERLSHIDAVFFDKTGTLTEGTLQVVGWEEFLPGATQALLALESESTHPIAKAVLRHFGTENRSYTEIENFNERAGFGISGSIGGLHYEVLSLGDNKQISELNERPGGRIESILMALPRLDRADQLGSVDTQVAILQNGVLAGILTLTDQIRSDSKQAIELIKNLGLKMHILSGDRYASVYQVATRLGISPENILGSISPEKKSEILQSHSKALMVGDGANDAVALASAYASVAVQGGMEISIRAAGVFSSQPGIMSIPKLIVIARETMRVIHRNLFFAILYNVIGIFVAVTGHLDPLFAAILMPLSALTVFLSTLLGTRDLRSVQRKMSTGAPTEVPTGVQA